MDKFVIKIGNLKKFIDETCDLVQKTNNDFPISEDEIKDIIEDENKIYEDEGVAFETFVEIFNLLDDESIDLYSDEIKEAFLDPFVEFTENIDEDDEIDDLVEVDMTAEKPKKKETEKPKKDKKDKSDKKDKKKTKESKVLTVSFDDAISFFEDVKEKVEDEDILMDEEIVFDTPTKSNLIEVIGTIFDNLEEDDLEELNDESQDFYKKYNKKTFSLMNSDSASDDDEKEEAKDNSSDKDDDDEPKEEKVEEKSKKKDKKADKPDKKKSKKQEEASEKKEDAQNDTSETDEEKVNIKESSCCGTCSEKTLILKGDATIIDALTKMLEVISK